jgi:hypothetical protein
MNVFDSPAAKLAHLEILQAMLKWERATGGGADVVLTLRRKAEPPFGESTSTRMFSLTQARNTLEKDPEHFEAIFGCRLTQEELGICASEPSS